MIYFLRSLETGLVKIGTTKNYHARLTALQAEHGELQLLGVTEGSYFEERDLHQRFAEYRADHVSGREWFYPGLDLILFIVDNANPNEPKLPDVYNPGYTTRIVNRIGIVIREYQAEKERVTGQRITQAQIATEAGIDPATLSRYANDLTNSYRRDVLDKLGRFFNVGIEGLFETQKVYND